MKFLGYKYKSEYLHNLDGKGGVLSDLKKTDKSLGIIDEDPRSFNKYPQLTDFIPLNYQHGLGLYQHNSVPDRHYVEIPSNLEDWFGTLANLSGLQIDKYQVRNRRGIFKKKFENGDEQNLFDFLEDIKHQAAFKTLENWISAYS